VNVDGIEDRRDVDLYRKVASGDPVAFEHLYSRYAPAAYGLARKVTGQDQLAQDVVHDAFLALWRAPEAFDPGRGAFRSFLLSIVHHRAVDTVRREERLRQRSLRMNPGPAEDEDSTEEVVEEAWLAHRRARVRAALRNLSPEQREVLELAYFHGYKQSEVAQALGIPLGTVKTRTLSAMRKLQRALTERDE